MIKIAIKVKDFLLQVDLQKYPLFSMFFHLSNHLALRKKRKENNMKTIKLILLAILATMYGIALSENGIVQLISWVLFIGLFMVLVNLMEKRYGE